MLGTLSSEPLSFSISLPQGSAKAMHKSQTALQRMKKRRVLMILVVLLCEVLPVTPHERRAESQTDSLTKRKAGKGSNILSSFQIFNDQ